MLTFLERKKKDKDEDPDQKWISTWNHYFQRINYQQIIKTMTEIKYNFIEEHKNILNTYYSIYSKRLDDIIIIT